MGDSGRPSGNQDWDSFIGGILARGQELGSERKQDRRKRREREIQRAALRVFARDGISKSRIQDIAADAGMPISSLYEYCLSKEELAYIVPLASITQFYTEFAAAAAAEPTAGGKLRLYLTSAADFARRNPDWARVLYLEIWPSVLISESPMRGYIDDFVRIIVFLIRQGAELGEWAVEDNPYELAAILTGSVNQLIITALLYRRPPNLARATGSVVERTLSLLRPVAGKKRRPSARSRGGAGRN